MTLEDQLFADFKGKAVLLDSNLLLVFLAGSLGIRVFQAFKRIRAFQFGDYEILAGFLASFSILLTTPHILTEVSNLAGSLTGTHKRDWDANFLSLIQSENTRIGLRENWTSAAELAKMPEFLQFGITDTALTRLASEALVVTEDYRLSGSLRSRGIAVLNFKVLRSLSPYAND